MSLKFFLVVWFSLKQSFFQYQLFVLQQASCSKFSLIVRGIGLVFVVANVIVFAKARKISCWNLGCSDSSVQKDWSQSLCWILLLVTFCLLDKTAFCDHLLLCFMKVVDWYFLKICLFNLFWSLFPKLSLLLLIVKEHL